MGMVNNILKWKSQHEKLIIFLTLFSIYSGNLRIIEYYDPIPSTYLPVSVLSERNLNLNEFHFFRGKSYEKLIDSNYYSKFPIITPLLVTPLYLVPYLLGSFDKIYESPQLESIEKEFWYVAYLGKLAASLMTAFSVVVFYKILSIKFPGRNIFLYSLVFGLGTSIWSICSQALHQHTTTQLFLLLALFYLYQLDRDSKSAYLAGLFTALAVTARLISVVFAVAFLLYVILTKRNQILNFIGGAIVPSILLLWYNYVYFGSIFATGYGQEAYRWSGDFWIGITGLLISPGRGLFIFSPVLIYCFIGIYKLTRKNDDRLLLTVGIGSIFYILLLAKWHDWSGGSPWSYRLIVDIVPYLMIFIPIGYVSASPIKKKIFQTLVVYSIFIQFLGASSFKGKKNDQWNWRISSIVWCLNETKPKLFTIVYDSGMVKRDDEGSIVNRFVYSVNFSLQGFYRIISPFPRYDWSAKKLNEVVSIK